jgi:uncharacterized membrane protein
MNQRAAITVLRPPDDVERLWKSPDHQPGALGGSDAEVSFRKAPGDRGTEIHVDLGRKAPGGKVGEIVEGLTGAVSLAKVKDDLRHFKQIVETGVIARSDGSPEGEQAGRKLKQHPAHPVEDTEKAGAR